MIQNASTGVQKGTLINRSTNTGRATASDGTTLLALLVDISMGGAKYQEPATVDDILNLYFTCNGTETQLNISCGKGPNEGIFDIWINGVQENTGYDNYAAAVISVDYLRNIVNGTINIGNNLIQLKVTSKNAASGGYYISVVHATLQ